MKYVLILAVVLMATSSCNYNKEELPIPDSNTPVVVGPTITYTNHTKRLFDAYCISCHASGLSQSNFPLTTYQEVTAGNYSSNGGVIENRVLIQQNMPPSGTSTGFLTLAEKDTLQMWLNQGALQ